MSGIAAIIDFDDRPIEPGSIERMTCAMAYRGPNGISHRQASSAALGYCAMHTTAEDLEVAQPLGNDDGSLIILFDGFVANYEELHDKLIAAGAVLRSRADAELALRAFELWGTDSPKSIEGEYAFLIWCQINNEVFVARDHAGLRPLFYSKQANRLFVASDLAAIVSVRGNSQELDRDYLIQVMADQWLSRRKTPWRGIFRLLPAHYIRLTKSQVEERRYWSLPIGVDLEYSHEREFIEHYRDVFREAVRRYSRTHLPLGCEVSGGLDSSAIFCVASDLSQRNELPAKTMRGYTFRAPRGTHADEIEFARAVATFTGRSIEEVSLTFPGKQWFLDQARECCDLPPMPNVAMSRGLGERLVEGNCRVNLNGLGGDQCLAVSPFIYHEYLRNQQWQILLSSLQHEAQQTSTTAALMSLLRTGLYPFLPRRTRRFLRELRSYKRSARQDDFPWLSRKAFSALEKAMAESSATDMASMRDTWLLNAIDHPYWGFLFDSLSLHYSRIGYEPRSPMMSRPYVELCARIPDHLKFRHGVDKHIHRAALEGLLPSNVLSRQDKAEFTLAFDHVLDESEADIVEHIPAEFREFIDKAGIRELYRTREDSHREKVGTSRSYRNSNELWGIVAATNMMKAFVSSPVEV